MGATAAIIGGLAGAGAGVVTGSIVPGLVAAGAAGGAIIGAGGKKIIGALTPDVPGAKPLPPLPTRQDPAIGAARREQQTLERRRRGRRSTILTSGQGVEDQLGIISRPQARSAQLLGE